VLVRQLTGREPGLRREAHSVPTSSISVRRNVSRPRRRCVLTVAKGRPVSAAMSASVSSAKNRRTTVSRYGSASPLTAARRASARSPGEYRGSGVGHGRGDQGRIDGRFLSRLGGPSARAEPGDPSSRSGPTKRDASSDPRQPGTEGTVAAPARKRAERDHERLLCGILSVG
jgi:hypothetical protein